MSIPAGRAFAKALEEAGVVSDLNTIQRIVIDIDADMARVYVQRIGDKRLLDAISGPLGMMLADAGPKPVRYWVLVSCELLGEPGWEELGLRQVELGAWESCHQSRWVLFEDPEAPRELDGKEVGLTIGRADGEPPRIIERTLAPWQVDDTWLLGHASGLDILKTPAEGET